MNKHKEFIKKAYNGELGLTMCSEWKELIENKYPEFKTKLEVGKWYKGVSYGTRGCLINCQSETGKLKSYGFSNKKWFDDRDNESYWGYCEDYTGWQQATEEEVFEALKNEAIKRGFKKGVMFKDSDGDIGTVKEDSFKYYPNCNALGVSSTNHYDQVFLDGKWSSIIETITKEEAEKQLGKKIVL